MRAVDEGRSTPALMQCVVYLEIGDRMPCDECGYPDDDLLARAQDGRWRFIHENGEPY